MLNFNHAKKQKSHRLSKLLQPPDAGHENLKQNINLLKEHKLPLLHAVHFTVVL